MNEQYIPEDKQLQYDINDMENKGAFDDPDTYQKEELLEKYNVYEKNSKGEPTGTINPIRLAKLLLENDGHHYVTLKDTEQIYHYNGSYWEPNGKQVLEQRINHYLDDKTRIQRKREVIDYMRNSNYVSRDVFQPKEHLINVKNGVYDFLNKELKDNAPEYYFSYEIPVDYDKEATFPEIQEFIKETLYVEDVPLLQEFLGDCLQPTYKYKKALMLVGETDTGKSQLLNLIRRLLGEQNLSHESLYDLCHDRFKAIELYGKLANICNELDPVKLSTLSKFLQVTGGDYISGQKKHQDPFKFLNYAKLLFACNNMPVCKIENPAYYNRWLVFRCDNQIPKEEQIPFLFSTFSDQELSGLLNWAIQGLERLAAQGHYSEHQSLIEITEFMREHGNPFVEFAQNIIPDITARIKKSDLYKHHLEFCKFFGYSTIEGNVFSRKIKKYLPQGYSEGYIGKDRAWQGFRYEWKTPGDNDKHDNNKQDKITEGQQETLNDE